MFVFFLTTHPLWKKLIGGEVVVPKEQLRLTQSPNWVTQTLNFATTGIVCLCVCVWVVRVYALAKVETRSSTPSSVRHLLSMAWLTTSVSSPSFHLTIPQRGHPGLAVIALPVSVLVCVTSVSSPSHLASHSHSVLPPLPPGMGKKDDPKLMQEWFKLVQEKNALVRYESELMIL